MRYFRDGSDPECVHWYEVNALGDAVRQLEFWDDGDVWAWTEDAWGDENGSFIYTRDLLDLDGLEVITAEEFARAWTEARPINTPKVRRSDPPVPATAAEMRARVDEQLAGLPWPWLEADIRAHLVEPELHWRRWDYGKVATEYPCWMVARWPEKGLGVAYCAYGHACDWGQVELDDNWFDMDAAWRGKLVLSMPFPRPEAPPEYEPWLRGVSAWVGGRRGG